MFEWDTLFVTFFAKNDKFTSFVISLIAYAYQTTFPRSRPAVFSIVDPMTAKESRTSYLSDFPA